MATSGSTDFTLSAGEVITSAFRRIKKVSAASTVPAELASIGLQRLNSWIKGVQAKGALLSAITAGTPIPVTAAQSYTLSPRALAIFDVRFKPTGGYETPMEEVTRAEYMDIPNKAATNRPSLYYFDRQRASSTLYVWGVGTSGGGTIPYDYKRVLEDLDNTTDDLDVSQEYLRTVELCLGRELAFEFANVGDPSIQTLIAAANEAEADMFADSRPSSYVFVPDMR